METDRISIVIPVYNVEKYLEECLLSVSGQSWTNLEMICVEDDSSDHSLDILTEFAKKDPRVRILRNNENRGLSYSRNRGIQSAEGKYLMFLDSDDKLKPGALQRLYETAETGNLDIVFFGAEAFYEDGVKRKKGKIAYQETYPGILTGERFFCMVMNKDEWIAPAPFQFQRKSFLDENRLNFYEGIVHEDELFTFQAMLKARRVMCLNDILYQYRFRSGSIMSSQMTEKNVTSLLIVYREMLRFCEEQDWDSGVKRCIDRRLCQIVALIRDRRRRTKNVGLDERYIYDSYDSVPDCHQMSLVLNGENIGRSITEMPKEKAEYLKKFQRIYIYGAGKIGKEVLQVIDSYNLPISGYVVSDKANNQTFVMGFSVYQIDDLVHDKEELAILIAVARNTVQEVEKTLKELGFKHFISVWNEKE